MKQILTLKSIWLYLFFTGFIITGCNSITKITIVPTTLITQSSTHIKATLEKTPIINPTPTLIPTQKNLPTDITTQTIEPTNTLAHKLQLTYITVNNGKYGIYGITVGCPEKAQPCLEKPELLFEYDSTIYNISWSPDGKRMVFDAVGIGGKDDIFVADWNGNNIANITNSPNFEGWPSWSPDGTRIGFTQCTEGHCQFISVKPDGSDPIRLIYKIDIDLVSAVWSPDMTHILFCGAIQEPFNQVYMSDIDGSNLQKITNNNADHYSQIYSPDGSMIAFGQFLEVEQSNKTNIYILSLVNNKLHNLTNGITQIQGSVQWSKFGNWLAFSGRNNDRLDIYLIHPDGSNLINVTQGNQKYDTPAWRVLP